MSALLHCLRVRRGEGIKKGARIYCELELRKGRPVFSKTVKEDDGTTEWNEEFNLIVGDGRAGKGEEGGTL